MKRKFYLLLAGIILLTVQVKAQAPNALNYQGVARGLEGAIMANSTISLRFTVHKGSASGPAIYEETQLIATNQFGLFSVAIGTGSVVTGSLTKIAWGNDVYFLQVEMDPAGGSNYTTMGTDQFLSVPYTMYADTSNHAASAAIAANATYSDTAQFARNANQAPSVWTNSGTTIYNNNTGGVGVGTGAAPSAKTQLAVVSAHQYGAVVNSDSLSNSSAAVNATFTGTGKFNAAAVMGTSNPNAGYGYGGKFTGGRAGVWGIGTASAADTTWGVYGSATSTGVAYGVYGKGVPVGTYGVSTGTGILFAELGSPYGQGTNTRVAGVVGEVLTGTNSSNYENDGVLGVATATGNYHEVGVCGYGTNATGSDIGVFGMGQGTGHENYVISIYGYEDPAQGGVGVGSAVADYAGYFIGDVDITGTLTAGTKNFRIDDPLDPANKYLYHDCVESPDMMDIYNGNVTTDTKGNASITLPDYFQALNKDFKYQLTVIGQFAQAIIGTEINNNQFTIKTDKPNVKVSWQVTGVRQDPFANNNRTVAEVPKKGIEKGHYLFPQYYGQPQSLSIANLISGGIQPANGSSSVTTNPASTVNSSTAIPTLNK